MNKAKKQWGSQPLKVWLAGVGWKLWNAQSFLAQNFYLSGTYNKIAAK